MKTKILGLTAVLFLFGVNAWAADGDLIVNGNVGIGNFIPSAKLDIVGPTGEVVFIVRDNTSGNAGLVIKPQTAGLGVEIQGANQQLTNVAPLSINPGGGNVGIGNFIPSAKLDIVGPTGGVVFIVRDNTSGNAGLVIKPQTAGLGVEIQGANQQLTNIAPLSINPEGGNVGIGNITPGYLLAMEPSGGGYYNQVTHAWTNGSSGRWKSNINPITGALDRVLQLNGVSFKWKKRTDIFETTVDGGKRYVSSSWADDPNERTDIGLIGEDVAKIVPEVVDLDPKDSNFVTGVDYSKLVAVLIEAIKDQQKQIDALRSEVSALKARQ